MAARFTKVDAVDIQACIEHGRARLEQTVAQLSDPECAIEVRPARRAPHPASAECHDQCDTDSKDAIANTPRRRRRPVDM